MSESGSVLHYSGPSVGIVPVSPLGLVVVYSLQLCCIQEPMLFSFCLENRPRSTFKECLDPLQHPLEMQLLRPHLRLPEQNLWCRTQETIWLGEWLTALIFSPVTCKALRVCYSDKQTL